MQSANLNLNHSIFNEVGGDQSNYTVHQSGLADDAKILAALKPVELERQGYYVPGCMEGTREGVFGTVNSWLDDFGAPNILWISGSPGAGKSAVASSLVSDFRRRQRLGSFFFFKRGDANLGDPTALWRTVAFDFARFNSDVKGSLVAFLKGPDIRDADIKLHFECMIEEPLRKNLDSLSAAPPVVVLDALDECGSGESQSAERRDDLLVTITSWSRLPPSFKLIVTSRDERVPRSFYDDRACRHIILETGDSVGPETINDIRMFFKKRFDLIAPGMGLRSTWPTEGAIDQLTERAAGLFIWAKTAMVFMEEEKEVPDERLRLILAGKLGRGGDSIDTLYRQILDFHFKDSSSTLLELFRAVLGALVVAKVPLHFDDLKHFLGRSEGEDERLFTVIFRRLSSVISTGDRDNRLRLRHLSFAEFLSDVGRCRDHRFFIDLTAQHWNLTLACMRLMNQGLRFNICSLETSHQRNDDIRDLTSRIERAIPTHLSYSCQFWAEHLGDLIDVEHDHHALLKEIENFLHMHLLYWLEVLSLIKEVSMASMALRSAAQWTQVSIMCHIVIFIPRFDDFCQPFDIDLSEFAMDASRFVAQFQVPISESAPHVYLSALPFSPSASRISKHYLPQFPQTLAVVTGLENNWSGLINVLTGHTGSVWSIAISPVGKCVVSGSSDGTICIWDAETGKRMLAPFKGHTDKVWSVGFSPDGKQVISGSADKTICIWDANTGKMVLPPLQGHTDWVGSVAFSPDGKHVVSGSCDKTIRIWDAQTGQLVPRPFEGHTDRIWCVKFSPNGKCVASGSCDKTIRIWDAETGKMMLAPFEGHTDKVWSVEFSPDGRHIISGSSDKKIRIWDAETGNMVSGPFEGHRDCVWSVSFSPDGKHFVSCSEDKTICIWDVRTGRIVSGPFEGHTDSVWSVAFSPDGQSVVSGSQDKLIHIWDFKTGQMVSGATEGHPDRVWCVAFSPDGKRVASGSPEPDNTICIWDAETGQMVSRPFKGHRDSIWSVAFSPNGEHVVSGSCDKTIRIWDVKTGEVVLGPFKGYMQWVAAVAFSPNGEHVVSVSGAGDKLICIWDARTGEMVSDPFEGHEDRVWSVAFSPDGKLVASGSADKKICIWDVETGQIVSGPFEGHTENVVSVGFSPDGKYVVSGSADRTIRIWDVKKGQMALDPFEGHTDMVWSVAFSPNGQLIVSGAQDKTICLWDANTGRMVSDPLVGHTERVWCIAFSPDGKRIVSCSDDKMIRIWNVERGGVVSSPFEHYRSRVWSITSDGQHVLSDLDDETSQDAESLKLDNGFCVDFTSGWVCKDSGSSLLFWVPPHHRRRVCTLQTLAIMGTTRTILDFSRFVHGSSWIQCIGAEPAATVTDTNRQIATTSALPMPMVPFPPEASSEAYQVNSVCIIFSSEIMFLNDFV